MLTNGTIHDKIIQHEKRTGANEHTTTLHIEGHGGL